MPFSAPGLVPKGLDQGQANQTDQPPVTPPPVKNVPSPQPLLPNAPTVQPPAPVVAPAVQPPQAQFAPPSVDLSAINPDASLRGQQILPGQDPRLADVRSDVDVTRGALTDFDFDRIGSQDASTVRSDELLRGAAGELGNAQLSGFDPIAGTDVTGVEAGIGRAQENIAGSALDTGASDITRDLALSQVQGLAGPNRQELAQRSFDLLGEQADVDFAKRRRDVGRDAATFGRIGSGKVTTDLGTLEGDRERFLAQAREGLGISTADKQLADQLKTLGATLGAGESFEGQAVGRSGLGLSQASAESGLAAQREALGRASRGEEVGERGFAQGQDALNAQLALERAGLGRSLAGDTFAQGATGRAEERGERGAEFDVTRATLGDLSGLETQTFNEGVGERNEFRDERDFQDQLARLSTDDAIRQIELEDQIQNSAFDREQLRLNSIGGTGFGGPSTSAFGNAASNLGDQAGSNTAFIQQLMAEQAARARPGQATTPEEEFVF